MQALHCEGSVRNAVKRETQPDSQLACSYGNSIRFDSVKGWLAIAKLKPLSLFISLLSMPMKAFDNVEVEK